jgi:hypothetical protein
LSKHHVDSDLLLVFSGIYSVACDIYRLTRACKKGGYFLLNDFLEFGSAGGDVGRSGTICSGVDTRSIARGGDDGGGSFETMISEAGEVMVTE